MRSAGMALQLTGTKGPLDRPDWRWIAAATSSLPVPLSPSISTGESESATVATTSFTRVMPGEPPPQRVHLAAQEALLEDLLHEVLQLVQVQRLDEVVVGPRLQRLDRRLDHRVAGHHDDLERRIVPLDLVEHLQAVHLGHPDVDQRGVEDLMADQPDRLAPARRQGDVVAPAAQRLAQELADIDVVVDDQDAWVVHRTLAARPAITAGEELEHRPVPRLGLIAVTEVT